MCYNHSVNYPHIFCSQKWLFVAIGEMLGYHFYRQQVLNTNKMHKLFWLSKQIANFFFTKYSPLINGLMFPYLFESFIFSNVLPCNMCEILSNAFWYYHKLLCKQSYCLSVKWPPPPSLSSAIFSTSVCVKGFPAVSYQGLYLWRLWLLVGIQQKPTQNNLVTPQRCKKIILFYLISWTSIWQE